MPNTMTERKTQPGLMKTALGKGFFRTLLLWFLAVSLIPLTVDSLINHLNINKNLQKEITGRLEDSARHKTHEIETFFEDALRTLVLEANRDDIRGQLQALSAARNAAGVAPEAFVGSKQWQDLAAKSRTQLAFLKKTNELYDVFLIDAQGNILFTLAGEKDLGTNIFTGPYSASHFGQACRTTFEKGEPHFSDFFKYAPSHDTEACFLVAPITSPSGAKSGLLAIQLSIAKLDRILQCDDVSNNDIHSFLVGHDLLLRSHSGHATESVTLETKVDTPQTRAWLRRYILQDTSQPRQGQAASYRNHNGVPVLGLYHNLDVGGVRMAVVTEIPSALAFRAVRQQMWISLALFLIVAAIVLILALWGARRVTRPIYRLTEQAERIAAGDLEIPAADPDERSDEFGLLARNFRDITTNLRDVASVCGDIALGVFDRTVTLRSDKDLLAQSVNKMIDSFQGVITQANNISKGDFAITVTPRSSRDTLSIALRRMAVSLGEQDWIKSGVAELNNRMRGEQNLSTLSQNVLNFLSGYLGAQVGAFFLQEGQRLRLAASYAYKPNRPEDANFAMGEGLVGQAALEKKTLRFSRVPANHVVLTITSGLGVSPPSSILVLPLMRGDKVEGVMEFGSSREFSSLELAFLEQVQEAIAINIQTAQSRQREQQLLEETQRQSAELQSQQEELKVSNEELEEQSEELRAANEELEEKTEHLEKQRREIQQSKEELEVKARQLAQASRYKSEFLSNMSHELRSPLNSLLILAKSLADNEEANLTAEQLEAARIIHNSGQDLLTLINDILDLSKVEAGRLELCPAPLGMAALQRELEDRFGRLARQKGLTFSILFHAELPANMITDAQRLKQILANLLNNAIKFTDQGSVTLEVQPVLGRVDFHRPELKDTEVIGFTVIDTGIGIPTDKQESIFEAFRQADGSTSRRYGGTGLGLTISRQLAQLLGGEIRLTSVPGEGCTFTLYLPASMPLAAAPPSAAAPEPGGGEANPTATGAEAPPVPEPPPNPAAGPATSFVPDDRLTTQPGDKSLLIIEDDPIFAKILVQMAGDKGYKAITAGNGRNGLLAAKEYRPRAIILDLGLPDIDGVSVLENLKNDLATRHIPVHIVSASDKSSLPLLKGAVGYLTKPATRENLEQIFTQFDQLLQGGVKKLLIVDDDPVSLANLRNLLKHQGIEIHAAATGTEAHQLLTTQPFDCIILDLGLPDMTGFDLLARLDQAGESPSVPVIVYTGRELTEGENEALRKYARTVVVKGVASNERLLDEVSLFMHSMTSSLPPDQQDVIRMIHDRDQILRDKKILLVDDDMRNTFALSGLLQKFGIRVVMAGNGRQALEKLAKEDDIDLVLMDIMMPVMDGYQATRRIRQLDRFRDLPIIALTAKAMPEDRQLCLEAGANDYLAKPIEQERLLSLLRVWLYS